MAEYDKVKAMCDERHGLRLEIIEMGKSLHRTIFAFVAVAAAAAGIYWKTGLVDVGARPALLFCLGQAEVFLVLFAISLMANANAHGGYIRALEAKINELCGDTIGFWESEVQKNFIGHYKCVFFWSAIAIWLFLLFIFGYFIFMAFGLVDRMLYGVLLTFEMIIIVALAIAMNFEQDRVARHCEKKFRGTEVT